jgi:hypothetical protein
LIFASAARVLSEQSLKYRDLPNSIAARRNPLGFHSVSTFEQEHAMDYKRAERPPSNYDCGEIIADSVIYAIGICFGLIGAANDCDDSHLVEVLE